MVKSLDINADARAFADILNEVQQDVSRRYSDELIRAQSDGGAERAVKEIVVGYVQTHNIRCKEYPTTDKLVAALIQKMVYFGVLTELLKSADVLEEVNVNAYDDIDVLYRDGHREKITNGFLSPADCFNTIRRLLQAQSGQVLDASSPIANAFLGKDIRICAVGGGVVDEDCGGACSIRFIGREQQEGESLLSGGTADADMLSFLRACVSHGVSVCIGGATGAGKTSTAGYLLNCVPDEMRIISCEEEIREVDLVHRDALGKRTNSVLQLKTVEFDNADKSVKLVDLLRTSLRLAPSVIFISEMRSIEAYVGQEASRTGHTVLTTVHCGGAVEAYGRMLSLAVEGAQIPPSMLREFLVEAFPIVIFQKKMRDGTRRITQIIEGEGYDDKGKLVYRTLWRYRVESVVENSNGTVTINGGFVREQGISQALVNRLFENGLPISEVNRFAEVRI